MRLPPISRPLERSAPEPALGGLRVCLGSGVGAFLVAAEIDRERLAHQRLAEIGHGARAADCDDAIELVAVVRRAIDGPAGDQRLEPRLRRPATRPVFAVLVGRDEGHLARTLEEIGNFSRIFLMASDHLILQCRLGVFKLVRSWLVARPVLMRPYVARDRQPALTAPASP